MVQETMVQENSSQPSRVIGRVVSDKMHKTIIVQVERKVKHPLYGKYMKRFSKMVVHDEDNTCKLGDLVLIQQSRPISKTKHWMLIKILEKNEKDAVA